VEKAKGWSSEHLRGREQRMPSAIRHLRGATALVAGIGVMGLRASIGLRECSIKKSFGCVVGRGGRPASVLGTLVGKSRGLL
jgi:hypothetical protein